jgi:hypothetical protein
LRSRLGSRRTRGDREVDDRTVRRQINNRSSFVT